YSMSAGLSPATMRQKRQSVTACYNTRSPRQAAPNTSRGDARFHGNVPQVQAADPQERQPREARQHVVPQAVPYPARRQEGRLPPRPDAPRPPRRQGPGAPELSRAHFSLDLTDTSG